jgi:hypothetical protein
MFASRPETGPGPGPATARAAVSVVAAGLLLGGAATLSLRTLSEWLAPVDARAEAPAATVAKPAPLVKSTPAANPAPLVKPAPAAKPAPLAKSAPVGPTRPGVHPAATGAAAPTARATLGPALRPVGAGPVVQTPAHLDEQVTYQYNALGRRDPFQAMLGGEFVGADVGGDAPVDVGGMKVVGIVWGTDDRFALIEDGRGNSSVLRAGDKVMNGVVESLRRDAVVVKLTMDGQTQSVAIPLTRKGDH